MYRCERCGKTTKPCKKQNKVVIETRLVTYTNKFITNSGIEREKVTNGYEIVKEINVCDECFKEEK